jgi:DNA-binding transcriptional MerR regulator
LDKAPDAFRTISEVADDLDIPQHVLRFWETRFAQIKPMKRSGGRRYYRPDDVDLLRGIRRLLYSEGYTIRGVQRILKEYGIKAVQGLTDDSVFSSSAFAGIEAGIGDALREPSDLEEDGPDPDLEIDEEDDEDEAVQEALVERVVARRAPDVSPASRRPDPNGLPMVAGKAASAAFKRDNARLKAALDELIACRKMLDQALEG